MRIGRREFVRWSASAFALGPAPPSPHPSPFHGEGGPGTTRLVLLGTGGGPSPKRLRSAPAQAILVGDDAYVVDCGDGVARQMVRAGVALSRIRAVFLTHHHSDHNADYGNLLLLGSIPGSTAHCSTASTRTASGEADARPSPKRARWRRSRPVSAARQVGHASSPRSTRWIRSSAPAAASA